MNHLPTGIHVVRPHRYGPLTPQTIASCGAVLFPLHARITMPALLAVTCHGCGLRFRGAVDEVRRVAARHTCLTAERAAGEPQEAQR